MYLNKYKVIIVIKLFRFLFNRMNTTIPGLVLFIFNSNKFLNINKNNAANKIRNETPFKKTKKNNTKLN